MTPRALHTILLLVSFLTAAAAASGDLLDEDARLRRRMSVRAAGIPIPELLSDLSARGLVRITAGPPVRNDRVILFVRDRPLAEIMRLVSDFFRFTWIRAGNPGAFTYTLTQTDEQKETEKREALAQLNRAADLILQQAEFVTSLGRMPPEEREGHRAELEADLQRESDPHRQAELCAQLRLLQMAQEQGPLAAISPIVAALSRPETARLLEGGQLRFTSPAEPSARSLSEPLRDSLVEAVNRVSPGPPPAPGNPSVALDIRGEGIARLAISVILTVRTAGADDAATRRATALFPLYPESNSALYGAAEPPDWRSIDALTRKIALPSGPKADSEAGVKLAATLRTIHEASGVDFISDSIASDLSARVETSGLMLGEIIRRVADAAERRWSFADGVVQLHHPRHGAMRAMKSEVTAEGAPRR